MNKNKKNKMTKEEKILLQEFKRKLGENIKRTRTAKGVRQGELALATYVDQSSLCMWEKGKRDIPPRHLWSIVNFLDVDITEIWPS